MGIRLQGLVAFYCVHGRGRSEDRSSAISVTTSTVRRRITGGMLFSDPALKIEWPKVDVELTLSEKDQRHPCLKDIEPWS